MSRTLVASDSFNRADGNLGGGDGWTQIDPAWGNVPIASNTLTLFGDNSGNERQARWTGAGTWTADQYAKLKLDAYLFDNEQRVGVLVRASGVDGTRSMYGASLKCDGTPTAAFATTRIWKIVAGTYTLLSAVAADGFVIGDTLEIEAEGTTIRVLKNGVVLRGVTDSSISGSSSSAGTAGGGDDWEGGNLVAAATPVLMGQGHI